MGKKSKRRKPKKKIEKRNNRRSDSEMPRASSDNSGDDGWTSLDESALLDYAENARQYSVQDELEVTRRLGSLNVSRIPCCNNPELFIVSSSPQTTCVEDVCPKSTLLEHHPGECVLASERRQSRKRNTRRRSSHHRPTKRLKRPRACSLDDRQDPGQAMSTGKLRRLSLSNMRFNPIGLRCSSISPGPDRETTGRQRGGPGTEVWSDASSRAGLLTESSSTPEDADMDQDTTEEASEDCISMDAQDGSRLSLNTDSRICSESDLSSTSDSGCEGDDEESSAEVFNKTTIWSEHDYLPSSSGYDQSTDQDAELDEILMGSFQLLSSEGQRLVQGLGRGGEFKHPQRFGILGSRGGKRRRKKPQIYPSSSPSPIEVNQLMAEFVSSGEEQVQLPLVSRSLCHIVTNLAQLYRLQCTQLQQKRCLPVVPYLLKRTSFTQIAVQASIDAILFSSSSRHRPGLHRPPSTTLSYSSSATSSPVVVGGSTGPLDETNVGNRILQEMGWKPGNGLGPREDGIKEPVSARLRPRYAGLGFSQH